MMHKSYLHELWLVSLTTLSLVFLPPPSRVRIEDEDSVINYKVCRWSSLKMEGWSTADNKATTHNQLRLIVGPSKIFLSFKRNVLDSSIMCFRVVVNLGEGGRGPGSIRERERGCS